jgi:hypothetical protein
LGIRLPVADFSFLYHTILTDQVTGDEKMFDWLDSLDWSGWFYWLDWLDFTVHRSAHSLQPKVYSPKSIAHTDLPVMVLLFLKPGPMIVTVNGKANVRGKRSP